MKILKKKLWWRLHCPKKPGQLAVLLFLFRKTGASDKIVTRGVGVRKNKNPWQMGDWGLVTLLRYEGKGWGRVHHSPTPSPRPLILSLVLIDWDRQPRRPQKQSQKIVLTHSWLVLGRPTARTDSGPARTRSACAGEAAACPAETGEKSLQRLSLRLANKQEQFIRHVNLPIYQDELMRASCNGWRTLAYCL